MITMKKLRKYLDGTTEIAKDAFAFMLLPPPEIVAAEAIASNLSYADIEPPAGVETWIRDYIRKMEEAITNKMPAGESSEVLRSRLTGLKAWLRVKELLELPSETFSASVHRTCVCCGMEMQVWGNTDVPKDIMCGACARKHQEKEDETGDNK